MSRHRSHVATSTLIYAALNWSFLISQHQSLVATSAQVFCRLQMVAPDVATSISCRYINLMNCNFQLMVPDVVTSILCRDISSYPCSFQLMSSVVATSSFVATSLHASVGFTGCFWCRDISLLSRQQLKSQQFPLFKPVIASRRFSCRDLHPLSRHHDAVVTSFL